MTHSDLLNDALTEIRVARAGDVLAPETQAYAARVYNRLLDAWNAEREAVYADTFATYTLTANLSPHTIGPTGTFVVSVRPVSLDFAAVNVGSNTYLPIEVRDAAWYANQPVPALTNTFPTDVYYEPDWPNGSLYFWGVPTTAYTVRLWSRVLLAAVSDLTATFTLPPGYQEALTLTLAEALAPGFGQSVSASTAMRAREARARIFGNNTAAPRYQTQDSGIPSSGAPMTTFNYKTRMGA